jgi:hypothetical protein
MKSSYISFLDRHRFSKNQILVKQRGASTEDAINFLLALLAGGSFLFAIFFD